VIAALVLALLVACGRGAAQPCPMHPATDLGGGPGSAKTCEVRR